MSPKHIILTIFFLFIFSNAKTTKNLKNSEEKIYEIEATYITDVPKTKVKIINKDNIPYTYFFFADGIAKKFDNEGNFVFDLAGEHKVKIRILNPPILQNLFSRCVHLLSVEKLNLIPLSDDASDMFHGCTKLRSVDLSELNFTGIKNMQNMFWGCFKLEKVEFGNINTEQVVSMDDLFSQCESLKSVDLSKFKTKNLQTMMGMFSGCKSLESADFSSFQTDRLDDTAALFSGCNNLKKVNFGNFEGKRISMMNFMFNGCSQLEEINLGMMKPRNQIHMNHMFEGCSNLKRLNLRYFKSRESPEDVFKGVRKDIRICISRYGTIGLLDSLSSEAWISCQGFD